MKATRKRPELDRRAVAARILQHRRDALVVAGLGAPCWDTAAAGDDALNFYTWGGMGGAAMVGLGLALAQPERRVLIITGDGEILMGLGSLATIGVQNPGNLAVVVMDNEHYGETRSDDDDRVPVGCRSRDNLAADDAVRACAIIDDERLPEAG